MADEETDLPVNEEETEETLDALELPAGGADLIEAKDIKLTDIAELENIRTSYHGIEQLAETMHLEGQLQPCWVREASPDASHGKPYELIFGYRRKRAAEYLTEQGVEGWDALRCEVRVIPDGEELTKVIVENFQRENPSPVAEARAMQRLKHSTDPPMSNAEVARQLGYDPSQVSKRLAMLDLGLPARPAKSKAAAISEALDDQDEPENAQEILETMSEAPAPPVKPADGGDPAPIVASSRPEEANEGPHELEPASHDQTAGELPPTENETGEPEDEQPKVDILAMIERGEISASTAEVIASLDKREDQEKLALLAKRHGWSVKKASAWARKAKEHRLDEGNDAMGPVEWVTSDDMVELPKLKVRDDLTEADYRRVNLYVLLRNGLDRELLDHIDEHLGFSYDSLWRYVKELNDADVDELTKRCCVRYVTAAHRYHNLEDELKEDLGATDETAVVEDSLFGLPEYVEENDDANIAEELNAIFGLPPVENENQDEDTTDDFTNGAGNGKAPF